MKFNEEVRKILLPERNQDAKEYFKGRKDRRQTVPEVLSITDIWGGRSFTPLLGRRMHSRGDRRIITIL